MGIAWKIITGPINREVMPGVTKGMKNRQGHTHIHTHDTFFCGQNDL